MDAAIRRCVSATKHLYISRSQYPLEWPNIETRSLSALTAAPETRLGKGTGQEPMIRFGSSDVANAVGSSLRARLRVSEAGERKGEMVRYHRFKEREFLLYPKQTWTDLLRAREDPNYEIDDIF